MQLSTSEVALNAVTFAVSALVSALTIRKLIRNRNNYSVKLMQPLLLAGCILFVNLASFFFTFGSIYRLTWRSCLFPFMGSLAVLIAIIFVMILRYYQSFIQTENKIRIAARLMDNKLDFEVGPLQNSGSWFDRKLEQSSVIYGLGFVVFSEFFLPMVIFSYTGMQDIWESKLDVLDPVFMAINLALGVASCSVFNVGLFWVVWQMKKKQKDITERIQSIIQSMGLMLTYIMLVFITLYASPLARISFQEFQFMPPILYHLPIFLNSIAMHRKVLLVKRQSNFLKLLKKGSSSRSSLSNKAAVGAKAEMLRVLSHQDGFKIFLEIAKREFAVENVLFYAAVTDWEAIPSNTEKKAQRAREIFNIFCSTTSEAPINVSYKVQMELETHFIAGEIRDNLFEAAKQEVLKLMLWQTFMKCKEDPAIVEIASSLEQV